MIETLTFLLCFQQCRRFLANAYADAFSLIPFHSISCVLRYIATVWKAARSSASCLNHLVCLACLQVVLKACADTCFLSIPHCQSSFAANSLPWCCCRLSWSGWQHSLRCTGSAQEPRPRLLTFLQQASAKSGALVPLRTPATRLGPRMMGVPTLSGMQVGHDS